MTPMANQMAPKGDRKGRPCRRVPTMTPSGRPQLDDRTGDRKGRPYRRVPPMTPMADHEWHRKGDRRKGRPYRRVPHNDTRGQCTMATARATARVAPSRRVPPMTPVADHNGTRRATARVAPTGGCPR
jgi:hypothetical protein